MPLTSIKEKVRGMYGLNFKILTPRMILRNQ